MGWRNTPFRNPLIFEVSEIAESLETAGIAGCCEPSSVASATHTLSPAYFLPYILRAKFGHNESVRPAIQAVYPAE